MTWSLEIHHIDVQSTGDATLIVARNDGQGPGQVAQLRTALIDGGRDKSRPFVDNYLTTHVAGLGTGLGQVGLNVIAVTHYDADHVAGITALLKDGGTTGGPNLYDNVYIFDQGEPQANEDNYLRYLDAIALRGNRTRITRNVSSELTSINKSRKGQQLIPGAIPNLVGAPPLISANNPVDPDNPIAINPPTPLVAPVGQGAGNATQGWWHPYWLVGREILWTDNSGNPIAPGCAGPPTITCIAANKFVKFDNTNNVIYRSSGLLQNPEQEKNERSLAFLVQFGNFKYYIGGDIETHQEGLLQGALNPANDPWGRVQVIKASHHGANTATSRAFIDRLRPDAAIISCGPKNSYSHPDLETINVLDGYVANPFATNPAALHGNGPPPYRPIDHYLTGYQDILAPGSRAGTVGVTAGDPSVFPVIRGDIRLTVSEDQAENVSAGLLAIAVMCAAYATAIHAADTDGSAWGAAAANAALASGTAPDAAANAAATALNAMGQPGAANVGAAVTNNAANGVNAVAGAVTTAALQANASQAAAAIAGAIAGAALGAYQDTTANSATATGNATVAAINTSGLVGVDTNQAGTDAAACVLTYANGHGLFTIALYDRLMIPAAGVNTLTHE